MSISQDRMERALKYLAETDSEAAMLMTDYEEAKEKSKSVFATLMAATEGTVAQREAYAYEHVTYKRAKDSEFESMSRWNMRKNKRATESIVIEVWRSVNASQRRGNVT